MMAGTVSSDKIEANKNKKNLQKHEAAYSRHITALEEMTTAVAAECDALLADPRSLAQSPYRPAILQKYPSVKEWFMTAAAEKFDAAETAAAAKQKPAPATGVKLIF